MRCHPFTVALVAALVGACGGEEKIVVEPRPEPAPVAPEPVPLPEPTVVEEVDPPPLPDPPRPRSSGRPASIYGPAVKIASTFGSTPGAKLHLKAEGGNITLVIPEQALRGGTNISWEALKSAAGVKLQHKLIGTLTKMVTNDPDKTDPERFTSVGEPFELHLPTLGKDNVSLAVGEIEIDAAAGRESVKWTVHAATGKGEGAATFKLSFIGPAYLHATSDAPPAAAP